MTGCNGCTSCERAGIQPFGEEWHTADGVFIKEMKIPLAGTVVPQHAHSYDHTSFLVRGSIIAEAGDADPVRYDAPRAIFIPALIKHRFTSLEDMTVILCIHRERDGGAAIHEEHQLEGVA
ncbi:cupin domain-containing protein [Acidisoma silvae]|uniref:Cupin domain-containing protein n=1 Tax=Acidisoma silvae TaxID=2802396 RepID=A0A964E1I5_9PROT|nr:hypothetical protein [Acidisoma silvae]MCB8878279.1 hypothetical protein [Acidisoma silvae]